MRYRLLAAGYTEGEAEKIERHAAELRYSGSQEYMEAVIALKVQLEKGTRI